MLTKESFLASRVTIPFAKTEVEGLGECGIVLFREGEFEKFAELSVSEQIANAIIGEDGERIFNDNDIEKCIVKEMETVTKRNVIQAIYKVNGYRDTSKEVKKN